MRSVRLGARLYLGANSRLALSLPPSACSNPLCRHPPPSSEGGEGAPAPRTEFAKVRTAVKPAGAGCPHPSRCSAKAQHRATFPKGKAMRSVYFGAQAFHFGAQAFWLAVLKFLLLIFLSTGQELHVHKGVNEGSLRGKFFRKNLAGSADFTEQTALRIGNEHGHSYLCGNEHF